jgi:hypothetical protein
MIRRRCQVDFDFEYRPILGPDVWSLTNRIFILSVINPCLISHFFWISPTKLQVEGWDVSRESLAKLESQFRRVPDCELLFLAKVLGVEVIDLFPAKLDLKKLDPALRLKVSTKFPRRKLRRS